MQVWAKSLHLRKLLKHPVGGGFPADDTTPANWPDDSFTHRLVQDGDILKEAPVASPAPIQQKAPVEEMEVAEEATPLLPPPKRKDR